MGEERKEKLDLMKVISVHTQVALRLLAYILCVTDLKRDCVKRLPSLPSHELHQCCRWYQEPTISCSSMSPILRTRRSASRLLCMVRYYASLPEF